MQRTTGALQARSKKMLPPELQITVLRADADLKLRHLLATDPDFDAEANTARRWNPTRDKILTQGWRDSRPLAELAVPAQPQPLYVGTNTNRFPPSTGKESIYLVFRDRDNLFRPYVRELEPLDVYPTTDSPDTMPYAIIADTTLALRAPKFLGVINRVNTQL